ncbi:pyridoxal phosphate-dependent decarboxylase family protein [Fimbriiglobus ruber]|uniref:Pyridoxal-dependent decarboxylase n=1 Tax=Fimbriiglobus ruber TaxID=1908690 RepID=A0A225EAM4_9BACT|nr:pyridoxal-dependent decarboxylase [Fimbriiglobus ruber]OWK46439.1 pyridoxal-dependent decarboxylase [Fimbriiglobus ruber]
MDRARYDAFVKTFFECDPVAVTDVFREFLAAMAAEEALPPGHHMSQNYDTAQANPEIHLLPGNLKDARDAIFPYFWGTDGWSSKLHLENVRGPANYASLIGAIACLLKNPNLCTDSYSQRSNELEVKAITALANLVFYHTQDPWGVFTIGGTISNMYGAKIGIEKVLPVAMRKGLQGQTVTGICSEAAHYCATTISGWLGIGTENLHEIPTDAALAIRLDLLAAKLDELYQRGSKVAFVIATFGTTDAFGIDDVAAIRKLVDEKAAQYGVPAPQLHADAAVGWGICFLNEYDFERNLLQLSPDLKPVLARIHQMCAGLQFADSVTLDFHKTGRGHYPSSAFIVNRKDDLKYLARSKDDTPYFPEADSRRDPALFTLETSRPGLGPYMVMASLNGIGLQGWQMLMSRSLELAHYLKQRLDKLDYCMVLNEETVGSNVVFWVLPKGRNAKQIFAALEAGTLPPEDAQRYMAEVHRLFSKRERALDPALDARLSFTTGIGYRPHGHDLPAWKAVFFNPKTDEGVIDRLIYSIEELV